MYPFTKYLKELNNEPNDDGSDANDEGPNKLAETVNAIDPGGRRLKLQPCRPLPVVYHARGYQFQR